MCLSLLTPKPSNLSSSYPWLHQVRRSTTAPRPHLSMPQLVLIDEASHRPLNPVNPPPFMDLRTTNRGSLSLSVRRRSCLPDPMCPWTRHLHSFAPIRHS